MPVGPRRRSSSSPSTATRTRRQRSASGGYLWLPEPVEVTANERVAVRFQKGSSATFTLGPFSLVYKEMAAGGGATDIQGTDAPDRKRRRCSELLRRSDVSQPSSVSVSEAQATLAELNRDDTTSAGVTDASTLLGLLTPSEAVSVGLTEAAAVVQFEAKAGTDTPTVGVTDAASVFESVAKTASDTPTIGLTESASVVASAAASDTATVSVTEAATLLVLLVRSDTPTVGVTESIDLARCSWYPIATIGLTEARLLAALLALTDAPTIGLTDASQLDVGGTSKSGSDTTAVGVSETAAVDESEPTVRKIEVVGVPAVAAADSTGQVTVTATLGHTLTIGNHLVAIHQSNDALEDMEIPDDWLVGREVGTLAGLRLMYRQIDALTPASLTIGSIDASASRQALVLAEIKDADPADFIHRRASADSAGALVTQQDTALTNLSDKPNCLGIAAVAVHNGSAGVWNSSWNNGFVQWAGPTWRLNTATKNMVFPGHAFTVESWELAREAKALVVVIPQISDAPPPPDTTPPTTPTGLSVSGLTFDRLTLSWTESTDLNGIAGYYILLDGQRFTTVGPGGYVGTVIAVLDPETEYSLQVEAVDPSGNVSATSAPLVATTTAQPAPPAGVVPVDNYGLNYLGDGETPEAVLTWTHPGGIAAFEILSRRGPDEPWTSVHLAPAAEFLEGNGYFYRVRTVEGEEWSVAAIDHKGARSA